MTKNEHFEEINVKVIESDDAYAKIIAEPFDRGYAVTVGNALRRTMLTSLPGAAVTSLRIDGITHEFTSIKGVVEDISDIILNLKELRFKAIESGPELITLNLSGPWEITGADLADKLTEFEVLNSDKHIATITEKINLAVDLRICRGKGYSPAAKNKRKDDTLDTIQIDAIFNPISNVSWNVQPIATSTEGFERLIMEVYSDGSIDPKDAINHAARILQQHSVYFMFDDSAVIKSVNEDEVNEALEMKAILNKTIDEMELSVISHNCLQAAGIRSIGYLVSKEESEMLKFKNFGRKSLTELQEKLGELNLHFGMNVEEFLEE